MNSLKRTVIRDTMMYSAANYVAMGIGIVVSIAMKAILGTVGAGYWAMMKVVSSYGEYSDLGTRDALLRELPQAKGAADETRFAKIRNSVFFFSILASFFSAAAILILAVFFTKDPVMRKGFFVIAFLVVLTHIYNFFLTLLRALKKVGALSWIIVVNMVFAGAFPLFGAWRGGVVGLACGFVVSTALSAFLAYRYGGERPELIIDKAEIIRLIKIGLPMVVLSYTLITFLSVDSVMIGKMISYQALGLYTIALMSVQQVSTLGRFTHIIIFPHIQEHYGRSQSLEASKDFFVRATRALVYFLPVVIAMVYFFVPLVVHYALPRFEGGILAMKILLLGYFFIAVNEMSSTIIFTINRQARLIPIYVVMVTLAAGLNFFFIKAGFGIEGVAMATAIAYFLFFTCVFRYSFRHILDKKELRDMFVFISIMFVYFVILLVVIDRFVKCPIFYAECLAKAVLFLVGFAPPILFFEREEGILGHIFELIGLKKRQGAHG